MNRKYLPIAGVTAAAIAAIAGAIMWFTWGPGNMNSVEATIRQKFPEVPQMSTAELAAKLAAPAATPPILVNVRTPDEYAVSHLKGARRADPDDASDTALPGVPKDAEIVVYCSVGYRSSKFARALLRKGYTHVLNLEGSIFKWANEGRAVYKDGAQVRVVHPFDETWGKLLKPELHPDGRQGRS